MLSALRLAFALFLVYHKNEKGGDAVLRICYGEITMLPDRGDCLPLSAYRREKLLACRSSLRRRQGIGGELLLIRALKDLHEELPLPLEIAFYEGGKPFLPGCGLYFSLSHSGDIAACALSDRPVGLDLEREGRFSASLLRRCFSQAEQDAVLRSPNPDAAFAELWTRKESYLKATGEGIVSSLAALELLAPPSGASFWHTLIGAYHLSLCALQGSAEPDSCENTDLSRFLDSIL